MTRYIVCGMVLAVLSVSAIGQEMEPAEDVNTAPWYVCPGLGVMDFEGDQDFEDGLIGSVRLGYDYTERWSLEGVLHVAPSLDANDDDGALGWSSTSAFGLALDGLFHFTRWDRVDPYLAAGIGLQHFGEEPTKGEQTGAVLRGGAGIMYHFNDEWALRADFRGMLVGFGSSPNANSIIDGGLVWTWGAGVKPDIELVGGPEDSDGDGLTDKEEERIGTDPYDPDTDDDRLSDGDEVNNYTTDPLNRDTDRDYLGDGDEVLDHDTDPKVRDTDGGGVYDGHEVLEDGTDPRKGHHEDDLMLFELYITFDRNESVIKPEFFNQLNVVAKVLNRNPESTAKIEGHADKTKQSKPRYNQRLSEDRATAVLDYFANRGGVAKSRMSAAGYGFDKPKEDNDPVVGNPANRRVDVYLIGLDADAKAAAIAERDRVFIEPLKPQDK